MSKELKISSSNKISNNVKSLMIKKICLELCQFNCEKIDFAGVVFFTKDDIKDPTSWALFINSEMEAFKGYLKTVFKFKIISYVFSEEKQEYKLHEHNIKCLGGDLFNYSNRVFCDIAFADIIKIDASAILINQNISYVFVRK